MTTIKHRFILFTLALLLVSTCVGCSQKTTSKNDTKDVLTQTVIAPDKIPVTILVKNAFAIQTFEKAAEKEFPQLDIIQVGNYTSDMGIAEYEARLKNGDLTDMVMTWPLDVGEEYWEDQLLDLSSLPLTEKYLTHMLNNISKDGALYYLPGPSQVRAIVYNKTLFAEHGWTVPANYEEFLTLCQKIEQTGIRSLQLGLGNEEVLDTAFVGYGYESSFSKPENAQKLADYNNGIGSFGDNFEPALQTFQSLINHQILQKKDLSLTYTDREYMLFNRQCAMIEDSVLLARMGTSFNGCTDEFALMPFFNPGVDSNWVRLYPVCYVGLNKHLAETTNKEKYDLIMDLLEYISTPEGQEALAGDTGAMFSSLKGMEPPTVPETIDLLPALNSGHYAIFPTLKNAQGALRKGLAKMVDGTMTNADVIKMVDDENIHPPKKVKPTVLGYATEDFSLTDTGNYLTDLLRTTTNSDIALFLDDGKDGRRNQKGVSAKFYKGKLTSLDTKRVFPDLRYGDTGELCKITMTGANLIQTLEYSIPVDNNQSGWFYYFSGLKMSFDPSADPGKRIKKITDEQGKKIDPNKIYTIAVMDQTVPQENILSCDKTGLQVLDLLENAIQKDKKIAPSKDGRFTIVPS
ncbi:MAG: extracellular solute-binding protein [Lachnospiraceae bacterium]